MSLTILYTRTAFNDIKKLDRVTRKKLEKKILLYSQNPISFAKKITDYRIGSYRWRVGNYRIVFDIDGNRIVVLRVGHRREIYR